MKQTKRIPTALSLAFMVGFFLLTPAITYGQINYQGRLTDSVGAPLTDGQYPIEFSLWSEATEGEQIWGPYILDGGTGIGHGPLADLVGSRFNVIIGIQDTSGISLTDALSATTTYLQIKVGEEAPITPRQIILPAPRALRADVIPNVTPTSTGVDIAGNADITGSLGVGTGLGIGTTPGSSGVITLTPDAAYGFEQTNGSIQLATQIASDAGRFGTKTNHPLNFFVNDGSSSLAIATNGNVGIGIDTPSAKLHVNGDLEVDKVNGESPPYLFTMGEETDSLNWHAQTVPGSIIEEYLGDADGGTVRFLVHRINDDLPRSITESIYIEQPEWQNDAVVGLSGTTFQQGGGESFFVLGNGTRYELIPTPWSWIYMRNYETRGLQGLDPGTSGEPFSGADLYKVEFLTVPNITVTVIIYDR